MNLCQAVKSAIDITMEKDTTAGEIAYTVCSVFVTFCVHSSSISCSIMITERVELLQC